MNKYPATDWRSALSSRELREYRRTQRQDKRDRTVSTTTAYLRIPQEGMGQSKELRVTSATIDGETSVGIGLWTEDRQGWKPHRRAVVIDVDRIDDLILALESIKEDLQDRPH